MNAFLVSLRALPWVLEEKVQGIWILFFRMWMVTIYGRMIRTFPQKANVPGRISVQSKKELPKHQD